ncbi:MAG: hypothetical protein KDJ28_18055 [Candidatus Competibacteraceae bacterium]|nr:hypothetical protein [Candidatus Competibacteraceae bacterium]
MQGLAEGAEKPLLAFRQAHSGKYVLPPPAESPDEAAVVDRDFLNRLAAYSRGIPGIARTLWPPVCAPGSMRKQCRFAGPV